MLRRRQRLYENSVAEEVEFVGISGVTLVVGVVLALGFVMLSPMVWILEEFFNLRSVSAKHHNVPPFALHVKNEVVVLEDGACWIQVICLLSVCEHHIGSLSHCS